MNEDYLLKEVYFKDSLNGVWYTDVDNTRFGFDDTYLRYTINFIDARTVQFIREEPHVINTNRFVTEKYIDYYYDDIVEPVINRYDYVGNIESIVLKPESTYFIYTLYDDCIESSSTIGTGGVYLYPLDSDANKENNESATEEQELNSEEYIFPNIITYSDMQIVLDQLSNEDSEKVSLFYKKIDINNLSQKYNKEELLLKYPILETEICYILRDVKDNVKEYLARVFADAGYTYDDYLRDKKLSSGE